MDSFQGTQALHPVAAFASLQRHAGPKLKPTAVDRSRMRKLMLLE